MVDVPGGPVAMQNGIPVPTFTRQGRARIDLADDWRYEIVELDSDLSLTPREQSLGRIVAEARGREQPGYGDGGWAAIEVPGTVNPIPDREEKSAWYRTRFRIPELWDGRVVTLKFGAANYLADVWLNGRWLGYHEGGSTPFPAPEGVWAWRRGASTVVALNHGEASVDVPIGDGQILIGTRRDRDRESVAGAMKLEPWEALVVGLR